VTTDTEPTPKRKRRRYKPKPKPKKTGPKKEFKARWDGSVLRRLRRERLLEQWELARNARVSLKTLERIERGLHYPQKNTQRKLLKALGIHFSWAQDVFPPRWVKQERDY